jgi:peptidoglycan biosynthesis protein MviN/MurJ (putative lipid II flippase)
MEPLLEIFSPELWAESLNQSRTEEYILAGRILLLLPLVFASQAILGVFLSIKKRFLVFSLAGVFSNVGSIVALATTDGNFVQVAIGMVVGGLLANFLYLFEALRQGFVLPRASLEEWRQIFNSLKVQFWKTWRLFAPRIFIIDGLYVASLTINPLVQHPGQVTAFDVGTSIQGAFFVVVSALSTVLFPKMSDLFYNEKVSRRSFWQIFVKYLRIFTVAGFGVFVITLIGAPWIMYLFEFLGKGQGSADYIVLIAQITGAGLVFRAVRELVSRYLYVRQRVWQPVILSLAGSTGLVLVSVGLYYWDWDAGLAVSWGLVSYNLLWVLLALGVLLTDWKTDKRLESLDA